jgi:Flp pilus assembly protein TadG
MCKSFWIGHRADNVGGAARRRRGRMRSRAGAAAVEFAVCLPVLIAVVLGSIEASNMIHVQRALTTAAYEAARVAAKDPAVTGNDVTDLAFAILDAHQVKDGRVRVTPAILATVSTGQRVTVTVTAPMGANRVISGWAPDWLKGNRDLSAECTVLRG